MAMGEPPKKLDEDIRLMKRVTIESGGKKSRRSRVMDFYLSVKYSILGLILVNVDIEPFNRSSLTELSKLSKNLPNISYLKTNQKHHQKFTKNVVQILVHKTYKFL